MIITRKHFIRAPFLAVGENFHPSLADCFFLVVYKFSFIEGLMAIKNLLTSFLDCEVRELPRWFFALLSITIALCFYPLSFLIMLTIMYCKYATKRGIKKQKKEYATYNEFNITIKKYSAGWDKL